MDVRAAFEGIGSKKIAAAFYDFVLDLRSLVQQVKDAMLIANFSRPFQNDFRLRRIRSGGLPVAYNSNSYNSKKSLCPLLLRHSECIAIVIVDPFRRGHLKLPAQTTTTTKTTRTSDLNAFCTALPSTSGEHCDLVVR